MKTRYGGRNRIACRSVAVRRWRCGLLREFTRNDAADAGGGGGDGGGDEADAEKPNYMNGNAYDAIFEVL